MHIGVQIRHVSGSGSLDASIRYYYVCRQAGSVLLAWFWQGKHKSWRVSTLRIGEAELEQDLLASPPRIKVSEHSSAMPPWAHELEGLDWGAFERETERAGASSKPSLRQRAERRLEKIEPLLARQQEVLDSTNPLRKLNQLAGQIGLREHPHRLALWFFAFLLHGCRLIALKPATHLNGTWSREEGENAKNKKGRGYITGSRHGWPSYLFKEKVIDVYARDCKLGVTLASIHTESLYKDFGCKFRADAHGTRTAFHPEGKPFPTYQQFRYIIVKRFGLSSVQKARFGESRSLRSAAVDHGHYTERTTHVLQGIEFDAYVCDSRALAGFSDGPMQSLSVCRALCSTTGAVVGIGFGLGSENQDAYRSMLFCMAVDKRTIAHLYGIPETDLDWPISGLAPSLLSDRGPGGHPSLIRPNADWEAAIKSITMSYHGQGKPTVESGNPKSVVLEGAPSYFQSDLSLHHLMKREVLLAAADNRTRNVLERIPLEMRSEFLREGYVATPECYWKFLTKRLRTCAVHIPIDSAVRSFCNPIRMNVTRHGISYKGIHYHSMELRESGAHEEAVRRGVTFVDAYCLLLVVRYMWVEFKGRLYQVEALRRTQFDDQDLYIPLSALEEIAAVSKELNSRTREASVAAKSEIKRVFKETTGHGWSAGGRRSGTPKRSGGASAEEAKVLRSKLGRRSA